MSLRRLDDLADISEGLDWLAVREPRFALARVQVAEVLLRRRAVGFGTLIWIIAGQQVSTAAAAAIWARLEAAGFADEARVRVASEAALCAAGLSRPKARYAQALARAGVDWVALAALDDAALIARLVALPGIGPWSAEVYATIAEGRADVLPAGDLALREAARGLFGLAARPSEPELRAMAEAWSPWRGVAARALWAYYRVTTNRDGTR